MALNIKKWSLETNLELINSGNGTMEIHSKLVLDENRKGKIIIVGPNTSKFVTVKDFLPPGIEEPWKLTDKDFTVTAKNVGTEDAQFNIFEEGPFRKSEFQPQYESEAHRIIDQHKNAIVEKDKYTMKLLVKNPIPDEYKIDRNFYSLICHCRAKIFNQLNLRVQADRCYEEGWKDYNDTQRWYYCIDWASTLIDKIIYEQTNNNTGKEMEKAIHTLDLAKQHCADIPFAKYNSMAIDGMKAFCICYLGEPEQARAVFNDFDFTPIPSDDFTDPMLNYFFSKISYSFAAAIELRDVDLVRNLSRIISTGRPELLKEASVQLAMRRAFGNVNENGRDEINNTFGSFIGNRINYKSHFPNLAEFLEYINVGDEIEMDRYFGFV